MQVGSAPDGEEGLHCDARSPLPLQKTQDRQDSRHSRHLGHDCRGMRRSRSHVLIRVGCCGTAPPASSKKFDQLEDFWLARKVIAVLGGSEVLQVTAG